MKKKLYERPSTEMVKLQQKEALLQTSGNVNATMNSTWEETDI